MATDDDTRPADPLPLPPEPDATRTPSDVVFAPDGPDPNATNSLATRAAAFGSRPETEPPLPPFAHFQPVGELGRGGMGVVYSALDTELMRDVAVKVLSERLVGNRPAERRFLEEARVTGQLTHTAIPPVYQMGTLPDGRPFLAMKLIKGRTLAEHLRDRRDPSAGLTDHLNVLEQVSLGVGYAHSRGVIHRDLKPGNVMVGAFREVQVMDWGLARMLAPLSTGGRGVGGEGGGAKQPAGTPSAPDSPTVDAPPEPTVLRDVRPADEELTRAGTVLGTPTYMSPEQASGDPERVTPRSDVFSLGAILCTILTGQPPYRGTTVHEVVRKAFDWDTADAFRRLAQCKADPQVIDLCKRCLAKDPAQRPANGEAVAAGLAEVRAAAADRMKRADLLQMADIAKRQEFRKRVFTQVGLGAAVLLIAGLIGLGVWFSTAIAKEREVAARTLRAKEAEAEGQVKAAREEADRRDKQRVENLKADFQAAVREASLALGGLHPDEPGLWNTNIAAARLSLQRAEGIYATLAPSDPLAGDQKATLDTSAATLARAVRRHELFAALDDLGDQVVEREVPEDRDPRFAELYAAAFTRFGFDLTDAPGNLANRVAGQAGEERMTEGLYEWYAHAPDATRRTLAPVLDDITSRTSNYLKDWRRTTDGPAMASFVRKVGVPSKAWVASRVARDLLAHGEKEAAEQVLRDGLKMSPADYRLNLLLARLLFATNTPPARREAALRAKAAATLRRLSAADAERRKAGEAYLLLGRILSPDDPALAQPHLHTAASCLPPNRRPVAMTLEAENLLRLNEPAKAEERFSNVVSNFGHTMPVLLGRVRAVWAQGDRDRAVRYLKNVPDLIPIRTPAEELAFARVARLVGQHDTADAAYRAAVSAAPNDLAVRVEFAESMLDRDAAGAEAVLKAAAEKFPRRHEPHVGLVKVYARRGEGEKAVTAGVAAVARGNAHPDADWALAFAQFATARSDRFPAGFAAVAGGAGFAAGGRRTADRFAAAAAAAVRFDDRHPTDPRGPDLRGRVAVEQEQWAEAVPHLRVAVERKPDDPELLRLLARCHRQTGDAPAAARCERRAADLNRTPKPPPR